MIALLSPLAWRLIGAALIMAALAGFLGWVHHKGYVAGEATVHAAWDEANRVATDARQKRIEQVRSTEQALRLAADETRKKNAQAIANLTADATTLRDELRNRPGRPEAGRTNVPAGSAGPGPTVHATGADLYRDDADFLVGFATDASTIRIQRDACYAAYERVRSALTK